MQGVHDKNSAIWYIFTVIHGSSCRICGGPMIWESCGKPEEPECWDAFITGKADGSNVDTLFGCMCVHSSDSRPCFEQVPSVYKRLDPQA